MKLNQTAMFGLCRALRKQFGELFLESRHSADSQETRGSFKVTRAAMFGLDARIALAIFGALSVISGAALYSAIQSARAESLRQFLNEIVKASEAYYLDNGSPLPSDSNFSLDASNLVENTQNLSTWKGPYFDGQVYDYVYIKNSFATNIFGDDIYLGVRYFTVSDWSASDDTVDIECTPGDCAEYISIMGYVYSPFSGSNLFDDMASLLDNLIDGGDGLYKGKVREHSKLNGPEILYQGIPKRI